MKNIQIIKCDQFDFNIFNIFVSKSDRLNSDWSKIKLKVSL